MITNIQQDQQQQISQKQINPLVFSARGQVNIMMEEINEQEKYFQSQQIKQQIKVAQAMNNAQVLSQLLEASEAHNQKLRDLIEIMKTNHTNEINRNYQLQMATENLNKNLSERQSFIQHLEKSLNDHRQRECVYIERIAELEEKICLLEKQNQKLSTSNTIMANNQATNNQMTYFLQTTSRQQIPLPDQAFNNNNNTNLSSGFQMLNENQTNINTFYNNQDINKMPTENKILTNGMNYQATQNSNNSALSIQNNLNSSSLPFKQQTFFQNKVLNDNFDSQNILSTDLQTQVSTQNKNVQQQQSYPSSSLQVVTLAADQEQSYNTLPYKPNQITSNLTRTQSFISHSSNPLIQPQLLQQQQQQQSSNLSNSNILSNSRSTSSNVQSSNQQNNNSNINNNNNNNLCSDNSDQSLNSQAYKKKIEQILQRENQAQSLGQGKQQIVSTKDNTRSTSQINSYNNSSNFNGQYNSVIPLNINTSTMNQQYSTNGSNQLNTNRQNQKQSKNQADNKNKLLNLSSKQKENFSFSKTPKKQNNSQNFQTRTTNQIQENTDQSSQLTNLQAYENSQSTPLKSSKSQNKITNEQNQQQNYITQNTVQVQQNSYQQYQVSHGLTRNQSQLSNLLSTTNVSSNNNGKEYQRSLSQINFSNYDNSQKTNQNQLNKDSNHISPILASLQNYQIQTQKEQAQNQQINPLSTTSITTIQNPNNQRNIGISQNTLPLNSYQQNSTKNQKVFAQNQSDNNMPPPTQNQSQTPKSQNQNLTKIKGTRQQFSNTLFSDNNNNKQNSSQLTNQPKPQSQNQDSGQKNNSQQLQNANQNEILNQGLSAQPSPNNQDANFQNGIFQNQPSYNVKNTKGGASLHSNFNTNRSASTDRNVIAQSLQGIAVNSQNQNDLLATSSHKQNSNNNNYQSSLRLLDGSCHSGQTTPQNSKGSTLNRPKETYFQSIEQRSISSHGQTQLNMHRRNLTPNQISSYNNQVNKHNRFTSYTQYAQGGNIQNNNYQQSNLNPLPISATSTPKSCKKSNPINIQQNQIEEGLDLESSPTIFKKVDEKYSNSFNLKNATHSKPQSHKQLQQPQSYQETIETMQSQQHFCAYSEENALFSNRNYNFSNIIKTISTNSNNKNIKDEAENKNKINLQGGNQNNQNVSDNKNERGNDAYIRNLLSNQKDYKYLEGDNDTKMSQESMSVMSSCMLVNNEHSLVYDKSQNGFENHEDGAINQIIDSHQLLTKYSNINLKIKDFSSKKSALFSKEASQASSNYIPTKLYEEFFITGPNNSDVQECIKQLAQRNQNNKNINEKQATTEAKVLYHYRNPNNISSNPNQNYSSQSKIINEFVFPFGCQIKQLKMTNSFSSINEILFANNSIEQGSSSVSCFVLAFKPDNDTSSQYSLNQSAQVSQSFPVYYSRVLQLLEKINPSKTLYCVCFKVKDFVESTKLDSSTIANNNITNLQKSYSTSNIGKQKMKFWQTEKVFCFVTYFPFVKFFLQIITTVLNVIKIKRIKTYNERLDTIPNTLSNIDSDFLTNTFIQLSEKLLQELAHKDLPDFNSSLHFNIQNERIISKIPSALHAGRLECEWGIYKALQQFDINNFLFLFLSLLLEHSLVFVTKNITLLTSTLLLFSNSILKPLKWINPMIFNLPQKLLPILDSPVPILVGINKDISYIQKEKIDQEFSNCVFIQLGSSFKVLNSQIVQDITLEMFNEIKEKIEPNFKKIQSHSQKGGPLQEHEELEIKEDCFALLETLNQYIGDILNKMPSNPIYSNNQNSLLDYEQITNQTIQNIGKHKKFLKTLFKTQMITYYIEEKYKKLPL
ncbi:DENN (AEX-3) domain protein (macronuclear) [Tetrahymena thermophila SB210]|uniref:DENN (AEX-3) domain protein n=1 Tax=Tetrahymena thermophila (strain SB210) TaxID=312017 RepID=I7LXS3_TETTS|nr:DENN (AEX-3) domain protein [Tetrahymena thermophila SB210]EAS06095.2 DENN (AEX-3) domain protein [Tetrahymena thermophila SB210]|eukprot:XP_001026340.2 DENN (AEX-3) domain protein [Tetrahymena thermophila SB210]